MVTSSDQPSTSTSTVTSSEDEVQSTTSTIEETPQEPVVPTGSDGTELFVNESTKVLEIYHNEKKWVFTYRILSWAEKYKCVDAAQIWTQGEFSFSLSAYYSAALTAMIIDSPVRPFTDTTLQKLDTDVVTQLLTIVPPPADPEIPDAAKKALGQVETG